MTLFLEELEHDGSRVNYLIGEFSESKDIWDKVNYENSVKLHVSCSCALFETEAILRRHILYILWHNYVTHIQESYILQRRRLDARYKNVAIEHEIKPFPNQSTQGTAILWTLRIKFNAILEMVSDSDIYLSKLDAILERFAAETSNDFKSRTLNDQLTKSETNVGSSGSVVELRDGEEINIHNPIGHVATKGSLKVDPG